jgi:hypothetical protein
MFCIRKRVKLSIKSNIYLVYKSTVLTKLIPLNLCGDKIKKNEMGGACSAYGGGERCVQGFGGET